MAFSIRSWLGETTTILGSAGVLGAGGAMLTGAVTWQQGLPVLLGAIAAAAMPENKAASPTLAATAGDLIHFGTSLSQGVTPAVAFAGELPALSGDLSAALALLSATHAATPPGATTTSLVVNGVASTVTALPLPAPAAAPAGVPVAVVGAPT